MHYSTRDANEHLDCLYSFAAAIARQAERERTRTWDRDNPAEEIIKGELK